jgi:hypothetical protein
MAEKRENVVLVFWIGKWGLLIVIILLVLPYSLKTKLHVRLSF